jgi:hypothetical protein
VQEYRSDRYSDTSRKVIEWTRVGDAWLIQRETAVALTPKP